MDTLTLSDTKGTVTKSVGRLGQQVPTGLAQPPRHDKGAIDCHGSGVDDINRNTQRGYFSLAVAHLHLAQIGQRNSLG
ncbi:MAG: hypothetical protein O3B73_06045 [bacterium]|nr:hypothetical protein [bacterium]